jgi:DGQHR domain-containing protein
MITVPAMRLHQFGVQFYQAIFGVRDIQKLVRFEVLSYEGQRTTGKKPGKSSGRGPSINWQVLEQKIAHAPDAYQRPVIQKKVSELMEYYLQCAEAGTLPAVPGAVLLTSERRLDFIPISTHRVLGVLQLPPEGGSLRALDGQHRLLAMHQLAEERPLEDVQVPAVIFDRLSADQVVELFVTINAKHTKLNPSHLISLSGRRLYPDRILAASHDIIRALNEDPHSPLRGEIKLFGVGAGRVAQSPLAEELKNVYTAIDTGGGRLSDQLRTHGAKFFVTYFAEIAKVFPKAWPSKRHSIKTAMALRAFLRVVPDVLAAVKRNGSNPFEAAGIAHAIAAWGEYLGDQRFETETEWRLKLAGGTRGTVDVLARELRSALRS